MAYQVSRELVKKKHEVVVYTSDAKDFVSRLRIDSDNDVDGIRVHYFRNFALALVKKFKLFVTPRLVSRAKEEVEKFDVIHLHEYRTFQNIVMAHYAKKYGVPYVLQAHGSLPRIVAKQWLKWIYDVLFGYRLLRDASKVIALSRLEAEQYRGMGVPEKKIAVIPNGIDLSEYANLPPKGSFRKKFGIDDHEQIVLYVGRIHRTKGIDFLIKAYAYLVKNMKINDVLLVIAGPDDGYLSEAMSLAGSLGLNDEVLFVGMLPEEDKISAYVDSNITVNVEPKNVFGLVPLEAAACSTPVIVSKGNAVSKIINNGKFGLSVEYDDITGLAEIMRKVISDDVLRNEMGDRGCRYVFENFNWTNVVGKLERVYEEILNSRPMDSRNRNPRLYDSRLRRTLLNVGRFFYWIVGICIERLSLGYLALTLTYKEMEPNQRAIEYGWVLSNLWKICGKKILDVGAGVSPFALVARRSGYDVTPIDKRSLPNVLRVDSAHLPWENDSYDGVTLISVIEHVPQLEAEQMLDEIRRVLKPTGLLFLTTDFSANAERVTQEGRVFTIKSLMNLLQDFVFIEITYFKSIQGGVAP